MLDRIGGTVGLAAGGSNVVHRICIEFVSLRFRVYSRALVTHHFSLFTVRCKYQLSRLTRLSLLDETFSIDEIDEVLKSNDFSLCPL